MSLRSRYDDAYLGARAIDGAGQTIKIVGLVIAGLIVLVAFLIGNASDTASGFAGLLVGGLVFLLFYVLGVFVSAQAQILRATLDTAVNTSPLLSQDEIRQILTASLAVDDLPEPSPRRDPRNPDGRCPGCDAPFWYADYRSDAVTLLCRSCRAALPGPPPAVE